MAADGGWKERMRQLDPIGTAVFLPGIVCLLLALQWGGSTYAWGNWRIILLFVIAGILIAAFVGIQFWIGDQATVPPRIVKQRSVLVSLTIERNTCRKVRSSRTEHLY